jgi:hypothetical protein
MYVDVLTRRCAKNPRVVYAGKPIKGKEHLLSIAFGGVPVTLNREVLKRIDFTPFSVAHASTVRL